MPRAAFAVVVAATVVVLLPAAPSTAAAADAHSATFALDDANSAPVGLWSDGEVMWVLDGSDDAIHAYDATTGAKLADRTITGLGAAGNRDGEGIWSDGTTMWVVDWGDESIYAYDLATGERRAGADVGSIPGASTPKGIWSNGETIWVADIWRRHIYAYSLASGERQSENDIGLLGYKGMGFPSDLWSDGVTMWVADRSKDKIFAFDLASGERTADLDIDTLAAAGNNMPSGLWSDGTTMWVSDKADGVLYRYEMHASAALGRLEIGNVDLGAFAPGVSSYEATVAAGTTQVTVSAAGAHSGTSVAILPADADAAADGHQVDLGSETTITVSTANGDLARAYTVTLTRSAAAAVSDDASLSGVTMTGVDTDGFSAGDTEYVTAVADSVSVTTVTAVANDAGATVTVTPDDADSSAQGHQVALGLGANTVSVSVTSSDGTADRTYTFTVNRSSAAPFGWDAQRDYPELSGGAQAEPYGIWSDGDIMWVGHEGEGAIRAYDAGTRARVPSRDITGLGAAGNTHPRGLWSDGTTMWVVDWFGHMLFAYDLATGQRAPEADFELYEDPAPGSGDDRGSGLVHAAGIWSDGETMWVGDYWDGRLYAYDWATGDLTPSRDIATDAGTPDDDYDDYGPHGIWSDGVTMWVLDRRHNNIFAYDLATGVRRADLDFTTLYAAGNGEARGIWSDGTTMWVADSDDARLFAYNMPPSVALASLELSGIDYGEFSGAQSRYRVRVPAATTATTVTAVAADGDATVQISASDADPLTDGIQAALGAGDNVISVTVSNGGYTRTYAVTVTQTTAASLSDDATLSGLSLSGIDIGTFDSAATGYVAAVASGVGRTTLVATAGDAAAALSVSPEDADPGATGHQVDLAVGANTITIDVESPDATEHATYTVTVNRASTEAGGWAVLSDLSDLADITQAPRSVWSDGTTMWVLDEDYNVTRALDQVRSDVVRAYSLATGERDADRDITLGAGNAEPSDLWSDGTTLWVADYWDDRLYAYSLATGERDTAKEIPLVLEGNNLLPTAMWSDGTTVWLADWFDKKLYAFALDDGARAPGRDIAALAPAGNGAARGMWSDGTTMWVADDADDKVYAYNLATGGRSADLDIDTLRDAGNEHPRGMWSDGATMWVADEHDRRIYSYNVAATTAEAPESGEAASSYPARLAEANAHPRAIWSDGTHLWVTDLSGVIFAYDLATMERVESRDIDIGTGGNHNANGMWSDGATLWVSDDADRRIYAYDLATGERRRIDEIVGLELEGNGSPKGLWSDGSTLWVSDHRDDRIYAYDLATGARVRGSDIAGLGAAGNTRAAAIWSDGTTMWVADDANGGIYAYDLATGARAAGSDITASRADANYNPKGLWSDGTSIWVMNLEDRTVYRYAMAEPTPADPGSLRADGEPAPADGSSLGGRFLTGTAPARHSGAGTTFTVRIEFSEALATSYRVLRDHALKVANGKAEKFRRVDGRSDLWEIHVTPFSSAAVILTLPPSADCQSAHSVCSHSGVPLGRPAQLVIEGPFGHTGPRGAIVRHF